MSLRVITACIQTPCLFLKTLLEVFVSTAIRVVKFFKYIYVYKERLFYSFFLTCYNFSRTLNGNIRLIKFSYLKEMNILKSVSIYYIESALSYWPYIKYENFLGNQKLRRKKINEIWYSLIIKYI